MRCLVLLLSVLAVASARPNLSSKCQWPKALCDGVCVNLKSDLAHCGACNAACRPGESCSGNVGANAKSCKCGDLPCGGDEVCCGDVCRTDEDLLTDVDNCGACGNACPAGNVCEGGECKCTASAQCPDNNPICGADGTCGKCSFNNDKGAPCAIRAAALGVTTFQCDYPEAAYGSGTGLCVECNMENRANDNDCAFLIMDRSVAPYAGTGLDNIPRIDAALTYCGANSVCTTPPPQ